MSARHFSLGQNAPNPLVSLACLQELRSDALSSPPLPSPFSPPVRSCRHARFALACGRARHGGVTMVRAAVSPDRSDRAIGYRRHARAYARDAGNDPSVRCVRTKASEAKRRWRRLDEQRNLDAGLVEERLVEAADILRRLPNQPIRGYFNTWPTTAYQFGDLVGQETPRIKLSCQPDAISRMEETLTWTSVSNRSTQDRLAARCGVRWKVVCGTVGWRAPRVTNIGSSAVLVAVRLSGRRLPRTAHVAASCRARAGLTHRDNTAARAG